MQSQPGQFLRGCVEHEDQRGRFEFGGTVEQLAADPELVEWPADVGLPQPAIVVRLLADTLEGAPRR